MGIPADWQMRLQRNRLLVDNVDKSMRNYLHSGKAVPQSLIDYRQALLDLPENNTPKLNQDGELIGVNWPTKPE